MAQIMTKRGNLDNIITYEFVCDTTADLYAIEPEYVTMGSIAVVISGDSGFEIYMANSHKEWISLVVMPTEEVPEAAVTLEDGTVITDEAGEVIIVDEPTV